MRKPALNKDAQTVILFESTEGLPFDHSFRQQIVLMVDAALADHLSGGETYSVEIVISGAPASRGGAK